MSSDLDARMIMLEHKLTMMQSEFLQAMVENSRSSGAINKILVKQEQDMKDTHHELTILTGVISSQGKDIKEIKGRLENLEKNLKDFRSDVDQRFNDVDQRFVHLEEKLDQRFSAIDERFAAMDKKFDMVLHILTSLVPGIQG